MTEAKKRDLDIYLIFVILASILFVAYWVSLTFYKYVSFNEYFWDLGQETYSMYIHLHNPGLIGGLQFLVFSNHISIFKLLLLPIFAVYQNPMTLVLIQDVSIGLCAIVAYLIGRDIVKNRFVGLALGIAFLLNPGVRGIAFFDVHIEAFIPLFLLLSFYFYMRGRRICFIASYITMLSLVETAPFVGISFILAMLLYELVYVKPRSAAEHSSRKGRIAILSAAFIITIAFMLFYYYVASSLISAYGRGDYSAMPPFLKLVNFLSIQVKSLGNLGGVQYSRTAIPYLVLWGALVMLFGFGLTGFRNIILTGILVSPWILEVLVLHNVIFSVLYYHYYAYVVGGALIAATLGFLIISRGVSTRARNIGRRVRILAALAIVMSFALSAMLLVALPDLPGLLPTNWNAVNSYAAVSVMLGSIPHNASVMSQPSIATHLYRILYVELPPNESVGGFTPTGFVNNFNITTYYTVPEYVVVNNHFPDYALFNNTRFNVYSYMAGNYTLEASAGGFNLYKRVGGASTAT
ncbi:MAG: DUF2079 domain-containing protein [Candidatus Micrarchaeota archaeon]|nr:DUF2079 domain-containing protein [Candidatus Micrarchaeota archaeon]